MLLILVLCLYCFAGSSQQTKIDSLKRQLKISKNDTNKVNLLSVLCQGASGEEILKYASEALKLSEELNFKTGIAKANAYLGKYYYFQEDFSKSLEYCIKAEDIANELRNYSLLAYVCKYIGYNYFLNSPKIAFDYYKKSIVYSRLAKDKLQESYAYSAIGNLYESIHDGKRALGYYLVSLNIREKIGNPDELASSLIETSRAYSRMEQYHKANELVLRALKIAEEKGGDEQNLINLYQLTGYYYADILHDYKTALDYFLKSYNLVRSNKSFNKNNIVSIKPVAEMYSKLGDYKTSAEYYKMYFELMEENQKKLDKELFESQDVIKKEMEKEKQLLKDSEILKDKLEIHRQQTIRNSFIVGFFILLGIVFLIYRNSKSKQKANVILENRVKQRTFELASANERLWKEVNERKSAEEKLQLSESKLTATNKELESFIYKASHDLKSPLASSRGLVSLALKEKNIDQILEYVTLIATSLDKLDNILIDLYEVSVIRQGVVVIKKIDILSKINTVIENFKGNENHDKIKFKVENQLTGDFCSDEKLLQTILRNIIENAIKYSKAGIENPFVNILIKESGPYHLIKVSDNGIGIPQEYQGRVFDVFFRATDRSKGSGLGLYIVKNAIDKLNGKVEIENSTVGSGTTFNLFFPKNVSVT